LFTRFIFSERLKVWVLPTIVVIKDGAVAGRIEGFESLGNVDDFPTKRMEKLLATMGAFTRGPANKENEDD